MLVLLSACSHGLNRLPGAFREAAVSTGVYSLGGIRVGEPIWLAAPPLPLALNDPIHITSMKLIDNYPITNVQAFSLSLDRSNRTAISVLEDRYFRSYGIGGAAPLSSVAYTPGSTLNFYPALKVHFSQPGHYLIHGFQIVYRNRQGLTGSQRIVRRFDLTVVS
jgi:hypothetical protein